MKSENTTVLWKTHAHELHSRLENLEQKLSKFEVDTSVDEIYDNYLEFENKLKAFKNDRKRSSADSTSILLRQDPALNIDFKTLESKELKRSAEKTYQEVSAVKPDDLVVYETKDGGHIKTDTKSNGFDTELLEEFKRTEAKLLIKDEKIAILVRENEIKVNENIELKLKLKDLESNLEKKERRKKRLKEKLRIKDEEIRNLREQNLSNQELETDYKSIEIETLKQNIAKLMSTKEKSHEDTQNEIENIKAKNKLLVKEIAKLQEQIEFLTKNQLAVKKHNAALALTNKLKARKKARKYVDLEKEELIQVCADFEEKLKNKEKEVAEYQNLLEQDRRTNNYLRLQLGTPDA